MSDLGQLGITVQDLITVRSISELFMVDKYAQDRAVVTVTLLVFETLSTLQDEVELLWPARWSGMKFLFVVNKYCPFIDTPIALTLAIFTKDPKLCMMRFRILTAFYTLGSICPELILAMRTIALWQFNKYIIAFIVSGAAVIISVAFVTIIHTLSINQCPSIDVIRAIGCLPCIQDVNLWPAYICLMLADIGIIGLTLVKRYLDPVGDGTRTNLLSRTLYRDGSLCFVIVIVMSIVNFLVVMLIPRDLGMFVQMPLRLLHSALATRVLLNLRKAAARSSSPALSEFSLRTTLAFEAGVGSGGDGSQTLSEA